MAGAQQREDHTPEAQHGQVQAASADHYSRNFFHEGDTDLLVHSLQT